MPVQLPTIVLDANGQVTTAVETPDVALQSRQMQMLATLRFIRTNISNPVEIVAPNWAQP